MMKISKGEGLIILAAVAFLAFTAGWFLRGAGLTQSVRVDTQWGLTEEGENLIENGRSPDKQGNRVDLNTAGREELMTLPGIGEKRADDIIADREANGPYRHPEDLTRVSGIGAETVRALLDYVTVEETP